MTATSAKMLCIERAAQLIDNLPDLRPKRLSRLHDHDCDHAVDYYHDDRIHGHPRDHHALGRIHDPGDPDRAFLRRHGDARSLQAGWNLIQLRKSLLRASFIILKAKGQS